MKTVGVPLEELVASVAMTSGRLFVVVDVGATNVRVGCVHTFSHDMVLRFVKRRANSAAELVAVLKDVEAALGPHARRVTDAAVAVPGPVSDNAAVLANYKATNTEGRTLRASLFPPKLCPPGRTVLLNDLEAAAMGIAGLSEVHDLSHFFAPMWGPNGSAGSAEALPEGNVLVLAPGTGLGNALLVKPRTGPFTVLPMEFGHTTAVAQHHGGLLAKYSKELYGGKHAVEFDDLCSGRGLERIYQHYADKKLDAAAISGLAKAGNSTAQQAVGVYFRFLMDLAGQLTMGLQLKGIIICGDNAVHNAHYLTDPEGARAMRGALLEHSMERMGFMSRVGVLRQHTSVNLNLAGCVYECTRHGPVAKL